MFVFHQMSKAIEGNTDPAIGIILFLTIVVSIAMLLAIPVSSAIERHKQKKKGEKKRGS